MPKSWDALKSSMLHLVSESREEGQQSFQKYVY